MSAATARTLLTGLTDREAATLLHDWGLWARDKQLPPAGDWRVSAFIS